MQIDRRNVLHNPAFLLQDYGTSAISTGHPATRWTLEWVTGSAAGLTAAPAAAPATAPKFLRDQCLEIAVTASSYSTANIPSIRQKVDDSGRHGQTTCRLSVWASGPANGSFQFGMGGRYATANTNVSAAGVPNWNRYSIEQTFDDIATTLNVEIFRAPVDLDATYRIGYVMLEYRNNGDVSPTVPELRTKYIERVICLPYVRPIGAGSPVKVKNTTTIEVRAEAWPRMRANPVGISIASSVAFKLETGDPSTGASTEKTAGTPTITLGSLANRDRGTWGGVFTIAGFTGLTAGDQGYITTPDIVALIEAELA